MNEIIPVTNNLIIDAKIAPAQWRGPERTRTFFLKIGRLHFSALISDTQLIRLIEGKDENLIGAINGIGFSVKKDTFIAVDANLLACDTWDAENFERITVAERIASSTEL